MVAGEVVVIILSFLHSCIHNCRCGNSRLIRNAGLDRRRLRGMRGRVGDLRRYYSRSFESYLVCKVRFCLDGAFV